MTITNHQRGTWQHSKATAKKMLAEYETQWKAAGMDPETLRGQAGPIATYATIEDYKSIRPEDHKTGTTPLSHHRALIRAFIKLIRTRHGFRAVPVPIAADEYFAWLGDRKNDAAQRSAFALHKFTRNPL